MGSQLLEHVTKYSDVMAFLVLTRRSANYLTFDACVAAVGEACHERSGTNGECVISVNMLCQKMSSECVGTFVVVR
jgi:hypothetical protein